MSQVSYGTITISDLTDIDSVVNYYLATDLSSGITKNNPASGHGTWTTNIQNATLSSTFQYLWNYEKILGAGNIEISSTDPIIIGHFGINGTNGTNGVDGNSITSIDEYYQATNSTSKPGSSGWSNTLVVPTSTNRYLWNYQVIHYSKIADEGSYNDARIIGIYGERGTSILKVTTAPTVTSGTISGFSYSYRMSLSTVKTQSGKNEVLVGDIIEYGSNHYQVGYVSSSYVYLGPVTSIKGADGQTYYTWIKYAPNDNPTNTQISDSPTGMTYIGIYTGTTTPAPSTASSYAPWMKYIGTDGGQGPQGVSVTNVRELYWLKTNSTNPSQIIWSSGQPSQTIYSDINPNHWTSMVPTYVTNGTYYTCIETSLSDGTKVWSAPVVNQALTNANSNATSALGQVVNLDTKLKTFFWPGDSSFSGAFAVGKGESDGLDVTNANTYGYNVRIQPSAVSINYNKIKFTQWDANELTFYEPKIVNNNYTQGNKALEIGADGLKLFKHYTDVENSPSVAATLTTEGLAITDGFINLNDGKFIVNSDGQANMQDILIKGEITGQMIADSIAVTDYGSNVIKGSTTEFKSYELSTDTEVNSNKTYYTRSISNNSYVYTRVSTPSGDPSIKGYYEDVVYMAKDLYISPYNSDPIQRIEAGIEITQDGIYFTQKYSDLPNSKIIIGLIAGAGDAKRPSTDTSVNNQKTYYTRKSSGDSYIYTEVSNPSGNPSTKEYYETIPLSEEFIIENLKPKRIIFGELEMFEYNNGLAIRRKN